MYMCVYAWMLSLWDLCPRWAELTRSHPTSLTNHSTCLSMVGLVSCLSVPKHVGCWSMYITLVNISLVLQSNPWDNKIFALSWATKSWELLFPNGNQGWCLIPHWYQLLSWFCLGGRRSNGFPAASTTSCGGERIIRELQPAPCGWHHLDIQDPSQFTSFIKSIKMTDTGSHKTYDREMASEKKKNHRKIINLFPVFTK